jgi:endogenous inhibitor of DNA gyrase (YacG/DUF329 family)
MSLLRCPICDRPFESNDSTALPFCSPRCRQIDLGRWLDERYGYPLPRHDDEDEPGDEPDA